MDCCGSHLASRHFPGRTFKVCQPKLRIGETIQEEIRIDTQGRIRMVIQLIGKSQRVDKVLT